ncbi:NGG1p interacting factor 3 [Hesseltinella vesiculosa]|uniref:NGG1p interacting factor 3 n=1 Tax=Hesseltinella vesiculosa TaxID=101127 RepID=A0A1X2GG01_9FUNG|nr:NGG1p interacting factor 3 [Hesseltinella vesiculosa]
MSLFSKVVRAMRTIAPLELADVSWDNVGVLVEPPYPAPNTNRVFLTIDLTPQVLDEALSDPKVGAIVAYHPPIFRSMKRLVTSDPKQDMVMKAIAKGVGIYSPHTACDNCQDGVNDWLASGLGKGTVKPIVPFDNPPEGHPLAGTGRIFEFDEPASIHTVVERVKALTKLEHCKAPHGQGELIKTVAICAGSGSSVLNSVDADLYLTGEMGHHDALAALAKDTSVILCEHSNTERGYLTANLKPLLEKQLGDEVDVFVSQVDRDPLQIV